MATSSRAEDCLPIAAAPPGPGGHLQRCKNEVLKEASSDAAFAAADSLSSALVNLQREDDSFYMPMYSAPPPAVIADQYCSDQLPPLPADGALASLDEARLLPFSDIDLEAFDNNADENKPPPVDQKIMIPPALRRHHHHHHHHPAAAGTRAPPIHGTTAGQNAGVVVHAAHQKKAMAGIEDSCLRRGGASGVEVAIVKLHDEHRQASSAAVELVPRPQPLPTSSSLHGWQCVTAKIVAQLEVEDEGNKVISLAFSRHAYEK